MNMILEDYSGLPLPNTYDKRYFEDLNEAQAWRQELIDTGSNLCEIE